MIAAVDHKQPLPGAEIDVQHNELARRFDDLEERCHRLGCDVLELYQAASRAQPLPHPQPKEEPRGLKKLAAKLKKKRGCEQEDVRPEPTAWDMLVEDARLERHNSQVLMARYRLMDVSPMHVAARSNQLALGRWLVFAGEQVDAQASNETVKGLRPLHYACQLGYAEFARLLIDAGADLRKADEVRGLPPVNIAAQWGHTELVALLQEAGCEAQDLPCEDRLGHTALHNACIEKEWDTARDILKRGAVHSGHIDKKLNTAVQYNDALVQLRQFPQNPLEKALLLGHLDLIIKTMADLSEADQKRHLTQLWSYYPEKTYGPMFDPVRYKPIVLMKEVLSNKHEQKGFKDRLPELLGIKK